MSQSRIKRNDDRSIHPPELSIMVIDDELKVTRSIETEVNIQGLKNFNFAFVNTPTDAVNLIEKGKNYDVISADYAMSEESFQNGIGLLKYLVKESQIKPKGCIIYTGKPQAIKEPEELWCKANSIQIITKSSSEGHKRLFEAIKLFTNTSPYLPQNPKYSHMRDNELLIELAKELLIELRKNQSSLFSFGSDTQPMKNSDVIKEIESLSPLGKEIIGNWFAGVKRNLDYLHRARLKTKLN